MKQYFTEGQKKDGINKLEIEDVIFSGEFIEGEGKDYKITGSAVVDGETYNEFVIEFELVSLPKGETVEEIMYIEWESYDFIFSY